MSTVFIVIFVINIHIYYKIFVGIFFYTNNHKMSHATVVPLLALSNTRVAKIHTFCKAIISIFYIQTRWTPIPMTGRYKKWVCGRSLVGTAGSNPAGGMDVCLL